MIKNEYINPYTNVTSNNGQYKVLTLALSRGGQSANEKISFRILCHNAYGVYSAEYSLVATYNESTGKISAALGSDCQSFGYINVSAVADDMTGDIDVYATTSNLQGNLISISVTSSTTHNYMTKMELANIPSGATIITVTYKEPVITYGAGVSHNTTYAGKANTSRNQNQIVYSDMINITTLKSNELITLTNANSMSGSGILINSSFQAFCLFSSNKLKVISSEYADVPSGTYFVIFTASMNPSNRPSLLQDTE